MAFVLPFMFAFGISSIFYLLVVLCALLKTIFNADLAILVSIELELAGTVVPQAFLTCKVVYCSRLLSSSSHSFLFSSCLFS